MTSVALTDHGNMMGAFHFVKEIGQHNKNLAQAKKEAVPVVNHLIKNP